MLNLVEIMLEVLKGQYESIHFFLLCCLIACAPTASENPRAREPDEPIVWNATLNELEAVVLPAIRGFDESLRGAYMQELNANREVVSTNLERRNIRILLVQVNSGFGWHSFFLVKTFGEVQPSDGFTAQLERAIIQACDAHFERVN